MSDVTDYLQSIEDRIDAINTCDMLQDAADSIKVELESMLSDISAQYVALMALITPPSANLGAIVSWIEALIATYTGPYIALAAESVLVATKITSILDKLTHKVSSLGCTFTPPTIP